MLFWGYQKLDVVLDFFYQSIYLKMELLQNSFSNLRRQKLRVRREIDYEIYIFLNLKLKGKD